MCVNIKTINVNDFPFMKYFSILFKLLTFVKCFIPHENPLISKKVMISGSPSHGEIEYNPKFHENVTPNRLGGIFLTLSLKFLIIYHYHKAIEIAYFGIITKLSDSFNAFRF